MSDDKKQALLDELESFKDKITEYFQDLGLGKDQVLRVHRAVDEAHSVVASHGPHQGHDLNDELIDDPQDHPALQGHVPTPISTDDPATVPSTEQEDPERRLGEEGEPHAPLAG